MYPASLYYSAMRMSGTKWAILGCALVAVLAVSLYFLNRPSASPPAAVSRAYSLTGLVLQVTPQTKHVSVANDDIPGFMQPMVMDYEIADPSALSALKRGDTIHATLLSDGVHQWVLQNITVTGQR
jgi:Cu/Ag efflux protein CusF